MILWRENHEGLEEETEPIGMKDKTITVQAS
jgi:hypothetical protein